MKRHIRLRGINGTCRRQGLGIRPALAGRPARHAGNRPRRQLGQPPPRRGPPHRPGLAAPRPGQHQRHLPQRRPPRDRRAAARARDIVQFGKVALVVEHARRRRRPAAPPATTCSSKPPSADRGKTPSQGLAFDRNRCPRPGEQLLALLRAGHHLVHIESEDDLLHSILNDAVSVLDAQRGAIVLADGPDGQAADPRPGHRREQEGARPVPLQPEPGPALLRPRRIDPVLQRRRGPGAGQRPEHRRRARWPRSCASCCGRRASKLGVLHLDRSSWQKPFTKDDLHLADALAANVSAGIECAQLLRKQRDLFFHDHHHPGPGGRAARRVHRRPHRCASPTTRCCWASSWSCRPRTWT